MSQHFHEATPSIGCISALSMLRQHIISQSKVSHRRCNVADKGIRNDSDSGHSMSPRVHLAAGITLA